MTIPKLITDGYNPAQFQNYIRLWKQLFPEDKTNFSCGCVAQKLYLQLKNYYEKTP